MIFILSSFNSLIKNSKKPVSDLDFLMIFLKPAASNKSKEALIAAIDSMAGLLNCHPSAPGIASNSWRILKRVCLLCPHHPANRFKSVLLA